MTAPLWKTCRILANQTRLEVLSTFLKKSSLCVQEVAITHKLSEVVASVHLKQLCEHDFLELERKGKWAHYRLTDPKQNSHAKQLIAPLKAELKSKNSNVHQLIRTFTAFTHPRRIDITKALMVRNKHMEALSVECGISTQALYRHLDKLINRGFIENDGNIYRLLSAKTALSQKLLQCCRKEPASHT